MTIFDRLAAGVPLGVVSGIVGYVRGWRTVTGRAGHAGTTPMDLRVDALVEAAEEILRIRALASGIRGAVATVGRVEVEPGGANVIPGRVRFSVDARAPDAERLDQLVAGIGIDDPDRVEAQSMNPDARRALRTALTSRGLRVTEFVSGAGHDAGVLATAGVSAGMPLCARATMVSAIPQTKRPPTRTSRSQWTYSQTRSRGSRHRLATAEHSHPS